MERVSNLKAEAADLNRIAALPSAARESPSQHLYSASSTPGTETSNQRTGPGDPSGTGRAVQCTATLSSASHQQLQSQPQSQQQQQPRGRSKGLQSSLQLEPGLANHWYPVAFSSRLLKDTLVPFDLLGQAWVLFRDEHGSVACVRDECAHRACPLSLGRVIDGRIQCPYHGWEYTGAGECVTMPSTRQCGGVCVSSLACQESDGFVFVWPGSGARPELPSTTVATPPQGFQIHAEIEVGSAIKVPNCTEWLQKSSSCESSRKFFMAFAIHPQLTGTTRPYWLQEGAAQIARCTAEQERI